MQKNLKNYEIKHECNKKNKNWLKFNNINLIGLDNEYLGKLVSFYIYDNPASSTGHTLKEYGWQDPNYNELKKRINKLMTNDEKNIQLFGFDKSEIFNKSIRAQKLEDTNCCLSCSRVVFMNSKKNICISLLAHIRNSLAHGLIIYDKDKMLFYLEDKYNGRITMRGILSKKVIDELPDIIKKGPN